MSDRIVGMMAGMPLQVGDAENDLRGSRASACRPLRWQSEHQRLPGHVETGGIARSGDVALIGVRGMLPGTAITLGIRPEFLRLRTPGINTLDAVVERLEILGAEVRLARPDGATAASVAKLTPAEAAGIPPGDRVALGFARNVLIFATDGQRIRQTAASRAEPAHA